VPSATADASGRRILVFGGTFDPPHLAHAALPAAIAPLLNCDEILYVPAAMNPLKRESPTSREHRMAMLLLATASIPNARISTLELDRAGPSYTVTTLEELIRTAPGAEFLLLIGADQALDFHRWKDWQRILRLARPVVMLRPPWTLPQFQAELLKRFTPTEAARWMSWTLVRGVPEMDIRATEIRGDLHAGNYAALSEKLDTAVLDYIRFNGLYQDDHSPSLPSAPQTASPRG
jgi:nicotinate-nucleotide adenylyltransferase